MSSNGQDRQSLIEAMERHGRLWEEWSRRHAKSEADIRAIGASMGVDIVAHDPVRKPFPSDLCMIKARECAAVATYLRGVQ